MVKPLISVPSKILDGMLIQKIQYDIDIDIEDTTYKIKILQDAHRSVQKSQTLLANLFLNKQYQITYFSVNKINEFEMRSKSPMTLCLINPGFLNIARSRRINHPSYLPVSNELKRIKISKKIDDLKKASRFKIYLEKNDLVKIYTNSSVQMDCLGQQ